MIFRFTKEGNGPINVKVIDPLNVKAGMYTVRLQDTASTGDLTDAYWMLTNPSGKITNSDKTIEFENEQLFLDEGLSITVTQVDSPGVNKEFGNGSLEASVEYDDPTKPWLSGFPDGNSQNDQNWIRAGETYFDDASAYNDFFDGTGSDKIFLDPREDFESLLGGTWAPYALTSYIKSGLPPDEEPPMVDAPAIFIPITGGGRYRSKLKNLASVDIVFTADKNKWSRCLVLEARNDVSLAEGGAEHLKLRNANSVDKDGNDDGSGTQGLGWFPGYAINVETGERLNMAFAEDSWLAGENGRDMKWNPTSKLFSGVDGDLRIGGKHYVYVFRERPEFGLPIYDGAAALHAKMISTNLFKPFEAMGSCMWVGIPMLAEGRTLLETNAKIKLRVEKPYNNFTTASTVNSSLPMYSFDMTGLEVEIGNKIAIDSALALINVVPNPYYAYSTYEVDKLDNRVKITNLPRECTISIYNVSGTLIRRFQKASDKTSLDWDIKNQNNLPIAGGVYLIHVDVPNVGERTLKWFGVLRPTDFTGF